jgi:hypothetical protein
MPRPPKINHRKRGFFTFAQNSGKIDYVRMAYLQALNIRATQKETPYLSIGITPGTTVSQAYAWAFDNVIEIPWGDDARQSDWKLENEWKAIHMSPYEETIKLDCDMLFLRDISLWWEMMALEEFHICNRVVDYRGKTITDDFYRKDFTTNNLPNIYTAITFFKKTPGTFELFSLVEDIFKSWKVSRYDLLGYNHRPRLPTTDLIFALALKLIDSDGRWYTENQFPTFVHMKTNLQGWKDDGLDEEWYHNIPVFTRSDLGCRIGNHEQLYPLHYHAKGFVTDRILDCYEKKIRKTMA